MPPNEPLWYCHQCHAEMRPLMAPDPVCASCRGSFVEKMENPADDPREFQQDDFEPMPAGIEPLLMAFSSMLEQRRRSPGQDSARSPPGFSFQMRGGPGGRTVTIGGPPTLRPRSPHSDSPRVPTMSEYLRRDEDRNSLEGRIAGPLMAQYLMALLGRDPFDDIMGTGPPNGQMGDYVFSQEALDRIITQIMENSNSTRPVPATQEIIEKLPREVLETGSPTLEKDCAVCKEQFKTDSEDPDEQVVVTLPCNHPFHEPCIIPWLKSSGTCPVCRHALIPQPEHHDHPAPGNSGSGSSSSRSPPASPRPSTGHENGIFHSLFGYMGGSGRNSGGDGNGSTSNQRSERRRNNSQPNLPGRWEDLD